MLSGRFLTQGEKVRLQRERHNARHPLATYLLVTRSASRLRPWAERCRYETDKRIRGN